MNIHKTVDAVGGIVLKFYLINEQHVSMDWESTWGWRYTKIEKRKLILPPKTHSVSLLHSNLFISI